MDEHRSHPVTRAVAACAVALDDAWDASVLGLDGVGAGEALEQLVRLEAKVAAVRARVLAHAQEIRAEDATGATSTAVWFAGSSRTSVLAARRECHLALALGQHGVLAAGLAEGRVNAEQAGVIARALEALPSGLSVDVVGRAEEVLVGYAETHDPRALKVLGRRILDVVAPELGEAHEARLLEAEERAAAARCRLTMTDDGHGSTYGRFTLPTAQAQMLRKVLMAYAAPSRRPEGDDERRPAPERMGEAFAELVEGLRADDAPHSGGVGATVVVTMSHESLVGGLAAASLDVGGELSGAQARRLACEAGLIPAVLGGESTVLDLGAKRRLFSPAQRVALATRDGGCTAEGCDFPPGLCHAHHDQPWSERGPTDLANGRLLCPRHHRLVHDTRYRAERLDSGRVRLSRLALGA